MLLGSLNVIQKDRNKSPLNARPQGFSTRTTFSKYFTINFIRLQVTSPQVQPREVGLSYDSLPHWGGAWTSPTLRYPWGIALDRSIFDSLIFSENWETALSSIYQTTHVYHPHHILYNHPRVVISYLHFFRHHLPHAAIAPLLILSTSRLKTISCGCRSFRCNLSITSVAPSIFHLPSSLSKALRAFAALTHFFLMSG
jgi:hypothetical protein